MINLKKIIFPLLIVATITAGLLISHIIQSNYRASTSESPEILHVYIAAISTHNLNEVPLSRAQFIGLINFRKLIPNILDTDTFNAVLCSLTDAQSVEYDAESLAMKWEAINDSIIYLQYIGEPIRGLIYTYNDTIKRTKWSFTPRELIWIGSQYVYRDTMRYPITPEITRLVDDVAVDVCIPDIYRNKDILLPIDF